MNEDDHRSLKRRLDRMEQRLSSLRAERSDCMVVGVGKTQAITTYPTNAAACYGLNVQRISGNETENTAATYTDTGTIIKAENIGSRVPPAGTRVIYRQEAGTNRFVFNY